MSMEHASPAEVSVPWDVAISVALLLPEVPDFQVCGVQKENAKSLVGPNS